MRTGMTDTVIVSGGNIHTGFALDFLQRKKEKYAKGNFLLIAADKGMEFFMQTGLKPDIAVGDFDSLSECGKAYLDSLKDVEIIRLKPEKDDSDTQSAVNLAVQRGSREIIVLGATGSRLDHVMANMGLLSLGKKLGVKVALADANNYICLIESGAVLSRAEAFGDYVSFFPVGGCVEGLTLSGFKYGLNNYCLNTWDSGLTVSNEFLEEQAAVTFEKGDLMMIQSRD